MDVQKQEELKKLQKEYLAAMNMIAKYQVLLKGAHKAKRRSALAMAKIMGIETEAAPDAPDLF